MLLCVNVEQPPEVFYKTAVLKNSAALIGKHLLLESVFNKVTDLQACNFIKKRHQHGCFPVNILKFLRTPILNNICERLLL